MITLNIPDIMNKPMSEGVFQEGIKDDLEKFAKTPESKGGLGLKIDDGVDSKGNVILNKDGKPADPGIKTRYNDADGVGKAAIAADTADQVVTKLNDRFDDATRDHMVDGRSIVARARNSVLQFPIYVTQTIRGTEGHIIAKMFEKVYASLVQTVISQNPVLSEDEANNLVFLRKYHTNIGESAEKMLNTFYEPIDDIDRMMKDSIACTHQITENCSVKFSVVSSDRERELILENARLMNEPLTGFPYLLYEASDGTVDGNDKTKQNSTTSEIIPVTDEELLKIAKQRLSGDDIRLVDATDKEIGTNGIDAGDVADAKNRLYHELEKLKDEIKNDTKGGTFNNELNGYLQYDKKSGRFFKKKRTSTTMYKDKSPEATPVNKAVPVPELLRTSDIKKINGMDPYMMKVTFLLKDPAKGINNEVSYIIGIKSVMHLIYADDLADELHDLVTGNAKSLQKVRYKTGEINFMDYLFNIKGLKADAAKNINYNKKWIGTLKRLADFNKLKGSLLRQPWKLLNGGGEVPVPNGTLILSQTDTMMLANKTGIDLSLARNAKRLAQSLFLIAVVIVDSSDGTMRVLFPDSDNDWDVQSLASIDAEVSKTDNSQLMRELNKMVNR